MSHFIHLAYGIYLCTQIISSPSWFFVHDFTPWLTILASLLLCHASFHASVLKWFCAFPSSLMILHRTSLAPRICPLAPLQSHPLPRTSRTSRGLEGYFILLSIPSSHPNILFAFSVLINPTFPFPFKSILSTNSGNASFNNPSVGTCCIVLPATIKNVS